MKPIHIFYGSVVILGGVTTFLLINRAKNKKMYNTLIEHLNTGINQTGTISDYGSSNKQPFHPGYYKTQGVGAKLMTVASAQGLAKTLRNAIGSTYTLSNESAILTVFKSMKAKSQVSFLAEQYQKLYNKDLLTDLQTVDYTLLGLSMFSSPIMPQIKAIVDQMPAK